MNTQIVNTYTTSFCPLLKISIYGFDDSNNSNNNNNNNKCVCVSKLFTLLVLFNICFHAPHLVFFYYEMFAGHGSWISKLPL